MYWKISLFNTSSSKLYSLMSVVLLLILTDHLSQECLQQFVKRYLWELVPGQDLTYKTLPVSRPKQDITVVLTQHTQSVRDTQ